MSSFASAALGLVAAHAWNDAVKETIKGLLGGDDSLASKHTYAVVATAIAVVVILVLTHLASRMGGTQSSTRNSTPNRRKASQASARCYLPLLALAGMTSEMFVEIYPRSKSIANCLKNTQDVLT